MRACGSGSLSQEILQSKLLWLLGSMADQEDHLWLASLQYIFQGMRKSYSNTKISRRKTALANSTTDLQRLPSILIVGMNMLTCCTSTSPSVLDCQNFNLTRMRVSTGLSFDINHSLNKWQYTVQLRQLL